MRRASLRRIRKFALLVSVVALGTLALAATAQAARIAVFDDPNYVDTSGGTGAEADNLQASLIAQGHTIKLFSGIASEDWSKGLAGQKLLMIPELEEGDLAADLDAAAVHTLRAYVNTGGGIGVFDLSGQTSAFLNRLFGYSIAPGGTAGSYALNAAEVAGTPFAGGPATLPDNDATEPFSAASLPGSATVVYGDGDDAAVVLFSIGSGRVVFLGWDWFDAAPAGSQNGGWLNVLKRTTRILVGSGCTITGTGGVDTLIGTRGADRICGRGGNDLIQAQRGADVVIAGDGNDRVSGNSGKDRLFGGRGADDLSGNAGRDKVVGGRGADEMFGNDGLDRLFGRAGPDDVFGNAGDDRLFLGAGADHGRGGPGDDRIDGGPGNDTCSQGGGSGLLTSC